MNGWPDFSMPTEPCAWGSRAADLRNASTEAKAGGLYSRAAIPNKSSERLRPGDVAPSSGRARVSCKHPTLKRGENEGVASSFRVEGRPVEVSEYTYEPM